MVTKTAVVVGQIKSAFPGSLKANALSHAHSTMLRVIVIATFLWPLAFAEGWSSDRRLPRYAAYDPPTIIPETEWRIVRGGSNHTLICEGSRGVNWRFPRDTQDDLRSRYVYF